ncbi:MAG: aspartate kinase [Thaumarchaeota archaeon]|nr:aspartate kinase [Nitrososphaerota archaeon]
MKIVVKFGGTSVGDGKKINNVCEIIKKMVKDNQVIVVSSALQSTTDELVDLAKSAGKGENNTQAMETIANRHESTIKDVINNQEIQKDVLESTTDLINDLKKTIEGVITIKELSKKTLDYILSFGERMAVPIISAKLREMGIESKHFTGGEIGIMTDENFGDASPLMKVTQHNVKNNLANILDKITPVVTGFIGITQQGEISTLGRGGSDFTASLIGMCLDVDEVWIMTDVDGLLTANPKLYPNAKTIPQLSYDEAAEMAIMGAKGMHPRALDPARTANIPVRIKNTFNPEAEGTLINKDIIVKTNEVTKAVTSINELAMITLSGMNMVGNPGTAGEIFGVLGRNNVNIIMISQSISEANITFLIKNNDVRKAVSVLQVSLLGKSTVTNISSDDSVSVISIVGAGMKGTRGVAARLFGAISRENMNVKMIAQGSSEQNISFVVDQSNTVKAIKAIHKEFNMN